MYVYFGLNRFVHAKFVAGCLEYPWLSYWSWCSALYWDVCLDMFYVLLRQMKNAGLF